jgi:hypothetical protein
MSFCKKHMGHAKKKMCGQNVELLKVLNLMVRRVWNLKGQLQLLKLYAVLSSLYKKHFSNRRKT